MVDVAQTSKQEDGLAPLLHAVADGDRTAFEALYRASASRLFGVCVRLLPDRAEAEDALQEVFTSIWRKAGQFDPARADAMAWLAMIARNKAIDRLRTQPALQRREPLDLAETIADPETSPADQAEAADERVRLDDCLDQLDGRRRTLIRTAFFDGATYEELAARTGSPLGTVKSWIRRGLAQLRLCLER